MITIQDLFWLIPSASVLALIFAAVFFYRMKAQDEGNEVMKMIAKHVRSGAMAYLRQGCDLAARDGRVRLMLECRLIMGGVCCNQLDLDGMEEHYRAAERMARALSLIHI